MSNTEEPDGHDEKLENTLKLFVSPGGFGVDSVCFDRENPHGIDVESFDYLMQQGFIHRTFGNNYCLATIGIHAVLPWLTERKPKVFVGEAIDFAQISAEFTDESQVALQATLCSATCLIKAFGAARYARLSDGSRALIFQTPPRRELRTTTCQEASNEDAG